VYRSVSVWVPLCDVDEQSGCMQFVPGSHTLDVLPHQSIDDDPRIHGLELTAAAMAHVANVASIPCRAGDAVVHTPYTLHHSPPNDSPEPRRAIVLIGGVKPIPRARPIAQPWLTDKRTARAQRAEQAAARGET
jgi:ectoine hydroxylase-related dioxygenase (phytanoyl-CoA dioxygenase family)